MQNKIKSEGRNYRPVKVKIKYNHWYIVKLIAIVLSIAFVVLGVLLICGY